MKRVIVGLFAAIALLGGVFGAGTPTMDVHATNPVGVKPLLSCPDVSGVAPVSLFDDIFPVANRYGAAPGQPNYHPLYDVADANGTIDLFNDIFGVANEFGATCPAVDLQVAKATLWGIANLPKLDDAAGVTALQGMGYYRGSSDVPGQGIHYTKLQNWDGTFDPQAPEGVVYNNGKLAAQLYVIDGASVGWGTHEAPAYPPNWPPPTTPHDVDLEEPADGAPDGPACSPACSWAGGEGWHLHYFLCTVHIGHVSAAAIPAQLVYPGLDVRTQSSCASFANEPECTVPVTTTPCYRFGQTVGWMGHLWNHELNPNQIADVGGNNGRFADCVPDGSGWKAFNCPS